MKKILAFGASNSRKSINSQLAKFAAEQLAETELVFLDLNDFEMPIYSTERLKESGVPEPAVRFKELIRASDGIIISFAEHNGTYTVAFKNLFDWASKVEKDMWMGKPMFLMATSPGRRGGQSVLSAADTRFPFMGGKVIANFSLPDFDKNFSALDGISDPELKEEFYGSLNLFQDEIQNHVEVNHS